MRNSARRGGWWRCTWLRAKPFPPARSPGRNLYSRHRACVPPQAKAMRIAIVSDIHGNRTAFEAVLADLRQTAPDLIFHGGDLADGGSSPVEIIDRIRDLSWPGISGNTDEMLFRPASLTE